VVLVVLLQQHSAQDIGTLENPWRGGPSPGACTPPPGARGLVRQSPQSRRVVYCNTTLPCRWPDWRRSRDRLSL